VGITRITKEAPVELIEVEVTFEPKENGLSQNSSHLILLRKDLKSEVTEWRPS
jgi:hypothetical protein